MELRPAFDIDTNINQTEYYWYKNGFSEQELDWINNLKDLYPYDSTESKERIKYLFYNEQTEWVYDKLKNYSVEANNTIWKFDLNSISDPVLYVEYLESAGHYDWHVDIGTGILRKSLRKISIEVQLSDPSEYEGGDFEIW